MSYDNISMGSPIAPLRPLELAVVVPTFNEAANVTLIAAALEQALAGISYEVVFVDDDSLDGTAALVAELAQRDPRVRIVKRVGRSGLSSACIEGMMATAAPYVAVIDGDMQHDERVLPQMLNMLRKCELDLVVGTRNGEGGSMGEFSAMRIRLSNFGKQLGNWVTGVALSDPMSGFFVVDRKWLETVVHLTSAVGFKVLLDLVASAPAKPCFAEVPYTFRNRQHGESKLDILVGLEYLQLLLDKSAGRFLPPRFIVFGLVGVVGLVAALSLQWFSVRVLNFDPAYSHIVVTVLAMVLNFFLNNAITYRSQRLRGLEMWAGLFLFLIGCGMGFWLNLQILEGALRSGFSWSIASSFGLLAGGVWNYAVSGAFTWRNRRMAQRQRSARVSRKPSAS